MTIGIARGAVRRAGVETPTTGMEDYYDLRAEEYDDFYLGRRFYDRSRPEWFQDRGDLEQAIASLAPASVLDVACGTGFLTRHLHGRVTVVDNSKRMLEVASRRLPDASLVEASAFELPFPDGAFERVFTGHFYGHLRPDLREAFLDEAARVAPELVVVDAAVRPGGPEEDVVDRPLLDGTWHQVYKRWFTGDALLEELGGTGEVLHEGPWFVMVSARLRRRLA